MAKARLSSSIERLTVRSATAGGIWMRLMREVQDTTRIPGGHQAIRHRPAPRAAGTAMTPISSPSRCASSLQIVNVTNREVAPALADAVRAHVEDPDDVEPLAAEFLVGVEGRADVPGADQRHLPPAIQAQELAGFPCGGG